MPAPIAFYPKDGTRPLQASILKDAGDGWYDILVDNITVEDGSPHRTFETRSRILGPFDDDPRGLFVVGFPPSHAATSLAQEQAVREAKVAARDLSAAYAGPTMLGDTTRVAESQRGAQGKRFSRSDILAIIKAERARINGLFPEANPPDTLLREGAQRLAAPLLTIFENLE